MSTQLKNNSSAVGLSGSNSKKKSKRWLWLLLLLVVIAIAIVLFALKNRKKDTLQIKPNSEIPVSSQQVTENSVINEENISEQSVSNDATKKEPESSTSQSTTQSTENYDEIARITVRGDYGNGQSRKNALGEKYLEVQRRVNQGKGIWWNPVD